MKKFSILLPIYGNEKNLPVTIPYIIERLDLFKDYNVELIMVCDGSPDGSYEIMKQFQIEYPDIIKIAEFTRNFGQGAALHCGIDMASGDAIGVISADLQDPFELFVDMLSEWENGYKFVIASRKDRSEKGIGGFASKTMHKLVNKYIDSRYPRGGFDFYLMDREVAKKFVEIDIPNGSMQMMLLQLGYEYKEILYVRKKRELGKSTWTFGKKINAASGLFVTHSKKPIRLSFFVGLFFSILGILALIGSIVCGCFTDKNTLIYVMLSGVYISFGLMFLIIGIVGEYIWRMFELQKGFPRYIIKDIIQKDNANNDVKQKD